MKKMTLLNACLVEPGMRVSLDEPSGKKLRVIESKEVMEIEAAGCPGKAVILGCKNAVPIVREGDDLLMVQL